MNSRRIVITGMGAVSPLGCGVEAIWQRLLNGQSGIRPLPEAIVADLQVKIGGQVPTLEQDAEAGFDPNLSVAPKDQKKMDRFILFAMAAADEAIRQAGWVADTEEKQERTATVVASGKHLFGTGGGVAVTSTKSATGHLLGAAGGLETIFTALALRDQIAPATLNLDNPDPAAEGLNLVAKKAQPMVINYALSNGFGSGGVNASILLKRWQGE